jgi:hypothetical protein
MPLVSLLMATSMVTYAGVTPETPLPYSHDRE